MRQHWQDVDTTGTTDDGHVSVYTVPFSLLCMLESFHNTRLGVLFGLVSVFFCGSFLFFFFLTKTSKSKRQGAESDPALLFLKIFPTKPQLSLHASTLKIIQNA